MHARHVRRAVSRPAFVALLLTAWFLFGPLAAAQAPNEPSPEPPPGPEAPAPEPAPEPVPDADTDATSEPPDPYLDEDGTLRTETDDGEVAWSWRPAAGVTAGPTSDGERVWIASGPYLLALDRSDGSVRARTALPFVPARIELEADVPIVFRTAEPDAGPGPDSDGYRVTSADARPAGFDADPALYAAVREGAATVAADEAVAAAERDGTDPWLALRAAEATRDADARDAWFSEAAARATRLPFFESAGVALQLFRTDRPDAAGVLMNAALHDLHDSGYDPRLLSDPALRAAYGLPHDAFVAALDRGDVPAARPLAPFAWRTASEAAPETIAALDRFSGALRAAGERQEARIWRDRAREARHAGLSAWIDGAADALGRLGWTGVAGLAVAFVAAWLVLLAKVWRGQSLLRRQARERGQAQLPVSRLWIPRTVSTTEKIATLALLVALALQTVLAAWGDVDEERRRALGSGTLTNADARAVLADLGTHGHAEALRGLAALMEGRDAEAVRAFEAAGPIGWARTNLALFDTEPGAARTEALEEALRLEPREPVARWATGREVHPSPFHEAYGDPDRIWAVPTPQQHRFALSGDWRERIARTATAPLDTLGATRPDGLASFAWWALVALVAALALAIVVFVPVRRPAAVRDAPRSPVYPVGALAVPGTGHLDELWGLLLLVPWALVGADAVVLATTGASALGLAPWVHAAVLGATYLAGFVGWAIGSQAYRRRMRLMRERKPELAKAYGLPPAPVRTDARKGPEA